MRDSIGNVNSYGTVPVLPVQKATRRRWEIYFFAIIAVAVGLYYWTYASIHPMLVQSEAFDNNGRILDASPSPGWTSFMPPNWRRYAIGTLPKTNENNMGKDFKETVERWFAEIIDQDFPRPRFVGSGSGEGTFMCEDFPDQWDGMSCEQSMNFMDHIISLNSKRLAQYLFNLVEDPENINDTMQSTLLLGGHQGQQLNTFFQSYGGVPYDLVQDFGGGSGAGFQIQCNGSLLFTAGGGGGGGFELDKNQTYDWQAGGGGGVQIYNPENFTQNVSLGGGSGIPLYKGVVDYDADPEGFKALWPSVKKAIQACPIDNLHLHGGGGGGGGISVRGRETYLWKYFYFYFEYGNGEQWEGEESDEDQGDAYQQQYGQQGQMSYGQNGQQCCPCPGSENGTGNGTAPDPNDYCLHIPDAERRKYCEQSRAQQEKDKESQKEAQRVAATPAAPEPAPSDSSDGGVAETTGDTSAAGAAASDAGTVDVPEAEAGETADTAKDQPDDTTAKDQPADTTAKEQTADTTAKDQSADTTAKEQTADTTAKGQSADTTAKDQTAADSAADQVGATATDEAADTPSPPAADEAASPAATGEANTAGNTAKDEAPADSGADSAIDRGDAPTTKA